MSDAISARRREREELLAAARTYTDRLAGRLPVVAAAVVGSVARGDFNVWSDIDVLVVVDQLPERAPDRAALLIEDAPPGVQPVGFTPAELAAALRVRNPLACEAIESGVVLVGDEVFREAATAYEPRPSHSSPPS